MVGKVNFRGGDESLRGALPPQSQLATIVIKIINQIHLAKNLCLHALIYD